MTMDITKSVAFTGHRSERILQEGCIVWAIATF